VLEKLKLLISVPRRLLRGSRVFFNRFIPSQPFKMLAGVSLLFSFSALAAPTAIQDYAAQIRVNGAKTDFIVPVVYVKGLGWLMAMDDFRKLGLVNLKPSLVVRGQEELVSLERTRGVGVLFDERRLELTVNVSVNNFKPSTVTARTSKQVPVAEKGWGGYLNYDLSAAQLVAGDGSGKRESGGANLEATVFSPLGSVVHGHVLAKDPVGNKTNARLETFFQRDFVDSGLRLRIGDSITNSGSWGRSVRFGGFKLGTDFSLRPDLITFPGAAISGSSLVPSTADVFVNGLLQKSRELTGWKLHRR
jgi:outer membrane usher protein FimD/PapC